MPPQSRVKPPTRGARQIVAENTATVYFYRNMALISAVIYHSITIALYFPEITTSTITLNMITSILYVGCHQMMCILSRPHYGDNMQILDTGVDLNEEGGIGEHIKDVVILTSITHLLSLLCPYFWLMLLILPLRVFILIWNNVLGPWFFERAPEETEPEDRRRRRQERRMRRLPQ